MPQIGLGTWQNKDPDTCAESVETALETGYRHIDTAQIYGNEEHVGRGIENSEVDRDDVFLATKVWIDKLGNDDVIESTEESLEKLRTDYVDLLYVHWPAKDYDAEETLTAFNELHDEGRVENIGVSNFTPEHLREAIEVSDAPVVANQVETHPLLQQTEMREVCGELDVDLVGYSPLARGRVFDVDVLSEIAEKHGVSEAQVSLAWLIEKDVHPIPKASTEEHILDNYGALELELDDEDVDSIDSLDRESRMVDPKFSPDW
ncbi:MAG: aldo/keto reductase [Halobacteria archaeon]|nr:aldo/keto reductase [Halobacteria archaeon]